MTGKMYLLVEADQCQADRLMTQMVDKLHVEPDQMRVARLPSHKDYQASPFIIKDQHSASKPNNLYLCEKEAKPKCCHSSPSPSQKPHHTEFSLHPDGLKAAITAEASVDPSGRAKAKISVRTNQDTEEHSFDHKPQHSHHEKPCKKESLFIKDTFPPSPRRNGLDPTTREMRGCKKFEYLPYTSKIPDYNKAKCARDIQPILADPMSSASFGYPPKKPCPANIPEKRINKYKECINRRDGLQDRCDGVTKKAFRNCCFTKKKC